MITESVKQVRSCENITCVLVVLSSVVYVKMQLWYLWFSSVKFRCSAELFSHSGIRDRCSPRQLRPHRFEMMVGSTKVLHYTPLNHWTSYCGASLGIIYQPTIIWSPSRLYLNIHSVKLLLVSKSHMWHTHVMMLSVLRLYSVRC
jgi:hypothetical protein